MKLSTIQQAEVALVWRDCQRIAAAECRARSIGGDLRREIVDKAILQTITAVARNQLTGDDIISRARSCAIDCIRTAATAHARSAPLTISVADECGFPATLDDPLTSIDLPVLSDQQIETVNGQWHRISSLIDVIASRFAVDRGIRFQFLSAVMVATANRIAGTDCSEVNDVFAVVRETAESLVSAARSALPPRGLALVSDGCILGSAPSGPARSSRDHLRNTGRRKETFPDLHRTAAARSGPGQSTP